MRCGFFAGCAAAHLALDQPAVQHGFFCVNKDAHISGQIPFRPVQQQPVSLNQYNRLSCLMLRIRFRATFRLPSSSNRVRQFVRMIIKNAFTSPQPLRAHSVSAGNSTMSGRSFRTSPKFSGRNIRLFGCRAPARIHDDGPVCKFPLPDSGYSAVLMCAQ